jgi:hypothetical protein
MSWWLSRQMRTGERRRLMALKFKKVMRYSTKDMRKRERSISKLKSPKFI